jgi:hypothetical protein
VVKIISSELACLRGWWFVVASVRFRTGGWDLRFRDPAARERTERFSGRHEQAPPEAALDRKAAINRELRRGMYVEREATFADYYTHWLSGGRVSATRAHTEGIRLRLHGLNYWGSRRLCDMRPSDVHDWVADLAKKWGRPRCSTATPCWEARFAAPSKTASSATR